MNFQIDYEPLLQEIEEMLYQDTKTPEENMISVPDVVEIIKNKKLVKGLEIPGWEKFNKATGGLRPHEFSILCGPTGAGKTTLLANMYATLMCAGVPTFGAPVEVGSGSFVRKIMSIVSGKHPNAIDGDFKEIMEKYGALFFSNEAMVISKYESRVNHKYLMADILYSYKTRGTKVALIDNLNFMMTPSRDQILQYDEVIHDWITFHKHVPIHSFMVMHPKKTENMRVESEGDIKGSSTAIQEAQNVFLFNRFNEKHTAPDGCSPWWLREIKLAKCRENGRFWGHTVLFHLDKVSEKYEEKGWGHGETKNGN